MHTNDSASHDSVQAIALAHTEKLVEKCSLSINHLVQQQQQQQNAMLTESGVSLFKMTCSKCGGKTGGPAPHGLSMGISWLYSFCALFTLSSLSLARAWNTSKSDWRTETKLFFEPTLLSTCFWWKCEILHFKSQMDSI